MKKFALLLIMTTAGLSIAGDAPAKSPPADKPAADKPAADKPTAEIKAGTGVENHEVTGEAETFPSGTVVWAWSRITNGDGNVKHVWKQDGKEIWTATLPVGSKRWATQSRRTMSKAGSYEVEVTADDGTSLGTVKFTIQ